MAASDQTYRSQKALDYVFAGSCIALLLTTIWMFVQDFQREFKQVQREFRDVEEAMAERAVLELAPDSDKLAKILSAEEAVAAARDEVARIKRDNQAKISKALPVKLTTEDAYRGIKADFDSLVSLRDIAVEQRNAAVNDTYRAQLTVGVNRLDEELVKLKAKLDAAKDKSDQTAADLASADQPVKAAEADLASKVDALKKLTADFDRFARLAEQKQWGLGDRFRSLPILDAFASPIRIQQYVLDDLPINYSFKFVTRYDRCTTCHLGIEQPKYTHQALGDLGTPKTDEQKKRREELEKKLAAAREAVKQRQEKSKGTYTISPGDLRIAGVELTHAEIKQYAAHPRLDLYVDGNSPHSAEKFGCSICHSGQGSATDFYNASHTPTNSREQAKWVKDHHWHSNHYWDFPMLPNRFIEASCVKCHHEMTDLIRDGSRVEAPKLMRGYQLVKDNGCFGCHEIAGIKAGRRVGPDLRLEPDPPLDSLTPAQRAKALADPLNPPGTMRKVGPSLRRLAEKTNEDWVRKWLNSPRDFRPDTKMPHFYNLSNNNPHTLTGTRQETFPSAEIHAITHYLFQRSNGYLRGVEQAHKDTPEVRAKDEAIYQKLSEQAALTDVEKVQLREATQAIERRDAALPVAQLRLPVLPADAKEQEQQRTRGRMLFSEKGCLACHMHHGTESSGLGLPAIVSQAQFGPNLSRLAAKLGAKPGDKESARAWLVQWIMNPNVHFPRTRMPITHLTMEEANDVAVWLLSQEVKDWNAADVPAPDADTLKKLARVYLSRTFTRREVDQFLDKESGIPKAMLDQLGRPFDHDDRELEIRSGDPQSFENKLKMYIGKKAIGQLGCFACHYVPGFHDAKPVGTPLNDWGKKDPERLAFEDVIAFVQKNNQLVHSFTDAKGNPVLPKAGTDGQKKDLYEKYFFDLLDHHQREGFLYQKLIDPRSYDYERIRAWDDRLRMPQFRFARSERRKDESTEQFDARQQKDEAEAREAVMTFILGLVAEPPPAKFVNNPAPDRLAEVKGRQVLEKYNCAGCHLVRPGVYEFNLTEERLQRLQKDFNTAQRTYGEDYYFPEHNAWAAARAKPERIKVFGLRQEFAAREEGQPPEQTVFPSEAVRFAGTDAKGKPAMLDIRAFSVAMSIPPLDQLSTRADDYGGTFGNLLVGYLMKKDRAIYSDEAKTRPAVPPSLLRQGEKTQPLWLFNFLREPHPIRPENVVRLRMPKFNMSEDEAMAIVNYFASISKVDNPGIGLEAPYYRSPEREESYLREQTANYIRQLKQTKVKETTLYEQRVQEMRPIWEDLLRSQLVDAQSRLRNAELASKQAEEDESKETDAAKKQQRAEAVKRAKETLAAAQKQVENAQAHLDKKDVAAFRRTWEEKEAYLNDGFKLLANIDVCLKCHSVGNQVIPGAQGPPLDLSWQRLRSDWVLRWLSYPQRFMYYTTPMPTNFPNGKPGSPELFHGAPPMQIRAARDALMNYPQVIDLPAARFRPVTVAGGPK